MTFLDRHTLYRLGWFEQAVSQPFVPVVPHGQEEATLFAASRSNYCRHWRIRHHSYKDATEKDMYMDKKDSIPAYGLRLNVLKKNYHTE